MDINEWLTRVDAWLWTNRWKGGVRAALTVAFGYLLLMTALMIVAWAAA